MTQSGSFRKGMVCDLPHIEIFSIRWYQQDGQYTEKEIHHFGHDFLF